MPIKILFNNSLILAFFLTFQACSNQATVANRYLTAERLWSEKNYQSAVAEFDQIIKDDPNSGIALQALLRSSMTKTLFLNQHEQALQGFKLYLEKAASSEQVPEVEIEMGEIYFSKLKQYPNAIKQYQHLLEVSKQKKYSASERPFFYYRIARSYFLLGQIKRAIEGYELTMTQSPNRDVLIKTLFDLGHAWYALGDVEKAGFTNAINAYTKAEQQIKDQKSVQFQEAEFGIASAQEELDQLEQAYVKFKSLENTYPAPNVIKIKLFRLESRLKKKRK